MSKNNWYDAYNVISQVAEPLIRQLRKEHSGYPAKLDSAAEWDLILLQIEVAFQLINDDVDHYNDGRQEDIQKGLDLFAEWFLHLWD